MNVIRLSNISNFGDSYYGLSEIRYDGAEVELIAPIRPMCVGGTKHVDTYV